MISSVSACHAKAASMSYSVRALGRSENLSKNTLRISFDYQTTMEDIEVFMHAFDDVLERIRS